jgi:hypothetical protein
LGLFFNNGNVDVSPFHSNAVFDVSTSSGPLPFKPAIAAAQTGRLFQAEIQQFSHLISDPNATERDLQKFFEHNDIFLKFLGYKHISAQVVLEKDDGTRLVPDFMALPILTDFWDIIDIKRPQARVYVGSRDRLDFAHGVRDLCSQLREYGAYFDDSRHQEKVRQKYGIKAYKPRLIGVIGNRPQVRDPLQARRVHSEYNCDIWTFDKLLSLARNSILI